MEYAVVTASEAINLDARVNELIKEGFKPTGGVSVVVYQWENRRENILETEFVYTQAMLKE